MSLPRYSAFDGDASAATSEEDVEVPPVAAVSETNPFYAQRDDKANLLPNPSQTSASLSDQPKRSPRLMPPPSKATTSEPTETSPCVVVERSIYLSRKQSKSNEDEGLQRIGCLFGGVVDDYQRRLPHYISDWTSDVLSPKALSASMFTFFSTFASTVALGAVISRNTACEDSFQGTDDDFQCKEGSSFLGITEYLLMNSIAGMFHAIVGCQPLLVLRPTGPITSFLTLMFQVAKSLKLPFLAYLSATGLFVGAYMLGVAALELSRYIKYMTRFIHDIFAVFVCSIYIVDGFIGMIGRFIDDDPDNLDSADHSVGEALFAVVLSVLLVGTSFCLYWMSESTMLSERINHFLVDYSLTIASLVCILISYLPCGSIYVERVDIPDQDKAALPSPSLELADGNQRSWFVDEIWDQFTAKLILAAAVTGIPIVIFFYFDQNISSLLCQKDEMHLKKGKYFHSSFMLMGVFDVLGPSLLGMPFVTGSLPHSPQLVKALESKSTKSSDLDDPNASRMTTYKVWENRVTPFFFYLLIGVVLVFPFSRWAIKTIPTSVVDGILMFVGLAGVFETQLWQRIRLLLTHSSKYTYKYPYETLRPVYRIHLWTAIQILALALAWILNGLAMGLSVLSPLGLCFPLVIVALVPVRNYLLPRLFTEQEIDLLDSDESHEALASEGTIAF